MNGLEALGDLRNCLQAYMTMEYVPSIDDNLNIIEKELRVVSILKEISTYLTSEERKLISEVLYGI